MENSKIQFKWIIMGIVAALVLVGAAFLLIRWREGIISLPQGAVFRLVPEKISQSAAIPISLPPGVSVVQVKESVSFEPSIQGTWLEGRSANELIFKPSQKLEIGKHYMVSLVTAEGPLKGDFLVDEDPRVLNIFPNADQEASETSAITIMFNRPMVPLTTLDEIAKESVPVGITPETPGKFKWISTRNLQFIPEKRLKRSSTYMIRVNAGFVSVEGLAVPSFIHTFRTRPLRYEDQYTTKGQILYHHPIRFIFNQPVDIERTEREITIKRSDTGANIKFEAVYGTRRIYDEDTKKVKKFIDKSIIEVYQAKDRHGREGFWDFATSYSYTIERTYPLEGDIRLDQKRAGAITVPEVIEKMSADSPQSKYVEPDLFDPEGRLFVTFFEEIDLARSKIKAQGLKDIQYGQKCKVDEKGEEVRVGNECEKEPDKKRIILAFNPAGLGKSQTIPITFEKIVNIAGLTLNIEDIVKPIVTYPKLSIFTTSPANNALKGVLTELTICTSTPLTPASEENFKERLQSNFTLGLWNWLEPRRIKNFQERSPCRVGEFENTIRYGLIPESQYQIKLNAVDDFKQIASTSVGFTSDTLSEVVRQFFSLQNGYNVTSPERTKLTYAVENLEYLNLHICEVTPLTMFRYITDFPEATTAPLSLSCKSALEKRIELPKKFWTRNYFQINLKDYIQNPLGHYVLSFGHPDYRQITYTWDSAQKRSIPIAGAHIYERTLLTVTRLAVGQKEVRWEGESEAAQRKPEYRYDPNPEVTRKALEREAKNLYWVLQFGTLAAVPDASVELYQKGFSKRGFYQTDAKGVAKADVIPDLIGAVVTKGADSTIVASDIDNLQWATPARSPELAYIYTDRPIYRPGQEVFIKGIHRIGYDGNYEVFRDKKAEMEIFNSKNESIFKQSLDVSDYGTFTLSFILDSKASLGTYRIEALNGTGYFDVEEYVPAAFKLEVSSDKEEYIAGNVMKLGVDANYYFGVPVEGGEVEFALLTQDYYFDRYRDGYFQFGAGWYYSFNGSYGDKFLLRGKTTLDANGKASIERELDFSKFFKGEEGERSKIFVASITVKNSSGQSVSTQKSFIVHRGEFYVGLNLEKTFLGKGEKTAMRIKSVDTKGKPVQVDTIAVEVNKVTWEYLKRQEVDGGYYYQTEKKKERVEAFTLDTDSEGNAEREIAFAKEGEYEVVLGAKDRRNNPISAVQDVYVYGKGQVQVRPTNNETLDLATEKAEVEVGERVKIIIKSPYPRAKALVSIERGKVFHYEVVDIEQNLVDYTFEVKESYIPNIYASVLLVSPRPEIKYGQINYRVNTKEKSITLDIKSNKTQYLPGETVELSIKAVDGKGKPVSAELSLAVADLSVLALKGNPKKNPLIFFYGYIPLTVSTASNVKHILYESEVPLGTKGGGGEPEDLTKKRRGVFKDTAYWQGVVRTDAKGEARVSFTLPDNLTTWQVEGVGITKNTKLGVQYGEFITKKDVMVIPLRPRFIIPGDEFLLGANIFNQTDKAQTLEVSLESETLEFKSDKTQSITIPSRQSLSVHFNVKAPERIDQGKHGFVLSAKNAQYEDTVQSAIPIKRNDTYETTATAGYTNTNEVKEYLYIPGNVIREKGGLSIKTSATLAVFLSDALNSLISFPYGCSEQIASKLSSLAIVKRGLNIENIGEAFTLKEVIFEGKEYSLDDIVKIGLSRIYENQTQEGGFSYYKGLEQSPHLTVAIVNALYDLKQAGYQINESALKRGGRYLVAKVTQDPHLIQDKNFVILAAYTLSRLDRFSQENSLLQKRIIEIASDKKFINEGISNVSLTHLAILLTKGYSGTLKNDIMKVLENRVSIDSRGAFLGIGSGRYLADYYETPIKDTALLLKAMVADKRESPLLDKILRWLLQSRAKDGAWGSTNNTASVVDAFTEFLSWKRETESQFNLALHLDGKNVGSFDFTKETILQTFTKDIEMPELPTDRLSTFVFSKKNKNKAPNNFYYDMGLTYFLPIDAIPSRDEGFSIRSDFYARDDEKNKAALKEAKAGEVMRRRVTITVPKPRNFVTIENFIPAGMELVNLRLATEDQSLKQGEKGTIEPFYEEEFGLKRKKGLVAWLRNLLAFTAPEGADEELPDEAYSKEIRESMEFIPDAEEFHDDRLVLFKERVQPGVYEYEYFVRALIPGIYHLLPSVARELYFPENFGRTQGRYFTVGSGQ